MNKTAFHNSVLIILPGFLSISATLSAQNGQISGTVTDIKTGEKIIGVNIMVTNTLLVAASDSTGTYTILELKPGKYKLKCQLIGYQPVEMTDITVKGNDTTQVDFKLKQKVSDVQKGTIIVPGMDKYKANPYDVDPNISLGDAADLRDPHITIADANNSVDPGITIGGTGSLPFGKKDSLKLKKKPGKK